MPSFKFLLSLLATAQLGSSAFITTLPVTGAPTTDPGTCSTTTRLHLTMLTIAVPSGYDTGSGLASGTTPSPTACVSTVDVVDVTTTISVSTTNTTVAIAPTATTVTAATTATTVTAATTATTVTAAATATPVCPVGTLPYGPDPNFANWTETGGAWSVAGGSLTQSAETSEWEAYALYEGTAPGCPYNLTNFQMDAYVTLTSVESIAGLLFRSDANGNGYGAVIDALLGWVALIYYKEGTAYDGIVFVNATLSAATAYHMRVTVIDTTIKIYVTDMVTPVISTTDTRYSSGQIGVRGGDPGEYSSVGVAQA